MIVRGTIRPPGDKSITHRALMLGAHARGSTELRHPLTAEDARSTARVLRQLGATVSPLRRGQSTSVHGEPWTEPAGTLHCGNAGTAARLMMGLLAAHPFPSRVTGDRSLRGRPMDRVTTPLRIMGAAIEGRGDRLPLVVRGGRLRSLSYVSPVASAQVKGAILFAGLAAGVDVTVREPWRSRDHTERLLTYLGFDVRVEATAVTLAGADPMALRSFSLDVPADPSSAAFLAAAAVLAEGGELLIEGVGVNPTRTGFLRVLARMGASIDLINGREAGGEPVADLMVRPAQLRGVTVDAHEIPSLVDEVPVLAVVASRAAGESVFRGVGELRVKESNRLELVAANLRAIGVAAEASGDDLTVAGHEAPPVGRVHTAHDHRLTMAFAVAGTLPGAAVALSERASAGVSYPGFFDDLATIGAAS